MIGAGLALAVMAGLTVLSAQPATALTSILRPDGDVVRQWSAGGGFSWRSLRPSQ